VSDSEIACREIIQNSLDDLDRRGLVYNVQITRSSSRPHFEFRDVTNDDVVFSMACSANTLTFTQTNTVLSDDAINFGSTKQAGSRGGFGEGMKIMALVLLKAGYTVSYAMQKKTWDFQLTHDAPAQLQLRREETNEQSTDLVITITGPNCPGLFVPENFVCFHDKKDSFGLPDGCTIFTHPAESGRIYVGGIYVMVIESLQFGYDMLGAFTPTLVRDRNSVKNLNHTQRLIAAMLAIGIKRFPALAELTYKALRTCDTTPREFDLLSLPIREFLLAGAFHVHHAKSRHTRHGRLIPGGHKMNNILAKAVGFDTVNTSSTVVTEFFLNCVDLVTAFRNKYSSDEFLVAVTTEKAIDAIKLVGHLFGFMEQAMSVTGRFSIEFRKLTDIPDFTYLDMETCTFIFSHRWLDSNFCARYRKTEVLAKAWGADIASLVMQNFPSLHAYESGGTRWKIQNFSRSPTTFRMVPRKSSPTLSSNPIPTVLPRVEFHQDAPDLDHHWRPDLVFSPLVRVYHEKDKALPLDVIDVRANVSDIITRMERTIFEFPLHVVFYYDTSGASTAFFSSSRIFFNLATFSTVKDLFLTLCHELSHACGNTNHDSQFARQMATFATMWYKWPEEER